MLFESYPSKIQEIINEVIRIEGGYVNHPNDPGKATKYGVTEALARKYHYDGDMRDLPIELAREILISEHVVLPKYDQVLTHAGEEVAAELIDSGINCGWIRAAKWLQRSLNAFNLRGKAYPDLVVDGLLGPKSFMALQAFVKLRGEEGKHVLAKACNTLQGAYYIEITENNDKFEDFIYGWIRARI